MATYTINFKLTNFLDSRIIEAEDSEGNLEEGVFIPLFKNCLTPDKDSNVIVEIFVNDKGNNYSYQLRQKVSKKHVEWLRNLGYYTPYLGAMYTTTFDAFDKKWRSGNERVKITDL